MTTPRVLCILLLYSIAVVSAVYTDIYRLLDAAPCVLLLNGTGTIGCTTPEGGTNGDLYVVRNEFELDYFYNNIKESKALALPAHLFNRSVVDRLHKQKVKGALLLYGKPASEGWSPDTVNPNSQWGLKSDPKFEWNPQGDGLNFVKIPFPVYALTANESLSIIELATNSTSFPRHAVQFSTFMHATQNAKTCLRRNQCQPLGGKSVWSSFTNITGEKEIVMAMANIDSSALFHDLATGADSTVSGIVGLIGAALALQEANKASFVRDIIFSFWAGESWGYLGSKKFLDDIQNFQCKKPDTSLGICNQPYKPDLAFTNIKLPNIVAAIELNQIGLTSASDPALFIHQQGSSSDALVDLLETASEDTFRRVNNTVQSGIPPSSMVPFLIANPNLAGVVVSDHIAEYTNLNYHSHTDNAEFNSLSNASLCNAATVLARTLYLLATNQSKPDPFSLTIQAPCELLANLTMCLSDNFSCPLLDHFLPGRRPPTPTYYTGVYGWSIDNTYASAPVVLVRQLMSLITASNAFYNFTIFNFTTPVSGCKNCPEGTDCVNGNCIFSETHYHDAISLGIDWDYSKNDWIIVNESEPLWVESNWDGLAVQLYRRANPSTEGVFLAAGIIEFIISLVAVFYAKRYFMRNYKIF